ncbi:hypothetical protein [Methylobacterium sp. Leaf89]|uniref:hypothetical protein n=1 Tax=Methylobacterium sp. Leaf89 TaxID=1736245 RepID=UPI0006FF605A|nr:hypothetical protein [Methylobacterium sp. Leaf89]KQO67240.1 hypothetical protein ASF18_11250 [Methylobacterium sp. Leaf89]
MNIQLIVAAVIFTVIAGLSTMVYVQYQENQAKTAKISQQAQALTVQERTISSLTAQAAEIERKHLVLSEAYADAETRLRARTRRAEPTVGDTDEDIKTLGRAIEGAAR